MQRPELGFRHDYPLGRLRGIGVSQKDYFFQHLSTLKCECQSPPDIRFKLCAVKREAAESFTPLALWRWRDTT
jgi:hypothetical protein